MSHACPHPCKRMLSHRMRAERGGGKWGDISSLWHLLPRPLLLEVVKAARVVRSPRRQLIKGLIDKVAASMHT